MSSIEFSDGGKPLNDNPTQQSSLCALEKGSNTVEVEEDSDKRKLARIALRSVDRHARSAAMKAFSSLHDRNPTEEDFMNKSS